MFVLIKRKKERIKVVVTLQTFNLLIPLIKVRLFITIRFRKINEKLFVEIKEINGDGKRRCKWI